MRTAIRIDDGGRFPIVPEWQVNVEVTLRSIPQILGDREPDSIEVIVEGIAENYTVLVVRHHWHSPVVDRISSPGNFRVVVDVLDMPVLRRSIHTSEDAIVVQHNVHAFVVETAGCIVRDFEPTDRGAAIHTAEA